MTELIVLGSVGLAIATAIAIPLSLQVINAATYSYCNARARGLSASIIPKSKIMSYTSMGFSEIIADLESGEYKDIILMLEDDFSVENLEYSLNRQSQKKNRKVLKSVPRKELPFFRHLISQFDYGNLKGLVRLKVANKFGRNFKKLFTPTQNFPRKLHEDFLSCNLEELKIKLRFTPYKDLIEKNLSSNENFNIYQFERALNKDYFSKLLYYSKKSPTLKKYSKLMIDFHNIRSLTSIAKKNIETESMVTGGYLTKKELLSLKNATPKEEENIIGRLVIGCKTITELRIHYEKKISKFGKSLMLKDPLSINSTLGYYIQKESEIRNLRRILKLRSKNIDYKDIGGYII